MKLIKYNQDQINIMINKLAELIRPDRRQFTNIVGIANGGLHVSIPLALKLNLTHSSVRISHYDGRRPRNVPIVEGKLPQATGNLIVDDLIDGGFTMHTFDRHFGLDGNATAVLFAFKGSGYKPTYFVQEKADEWLVFPWDSNSGNLGVN